MTKINHVNEALTERRAQKIKTQVQHCLRTYEGDDLADKLIMLSAEWFLKGVFIGIHQKEKE